jgi:uncharacterized protein (UPF0264 family)
MQRLLVSVRGKNEALEAVKGGAAIVDVEFPASALGTPYPLNVMAVRNSVPRHVLVSTNIGEEQGARRSTACQAAVGVGVAGADIIKAGLARMSLREAQYLGRGIVRSVRQLCPGKSVIPVVFADTEMARNFLDPVDEGVDLAVAIKADGALIDTFDKDAGKSLIDYLSEEQLRRFVRKCHRHGIQAWLAGSITAEQIQGLWALRTDVICVRAAACGIAEGKGRFGDVLASRVAALLPRSR